MSKPRLSLDELQTRFSTEEACVEYLFQMKWPHGFRCPRCEHHQAYITTTRRHPLYECTQCRHQTSVIVGTVMEGSRTDLRKWLTALFLASDDSCGISALRLSEIIHVTYKTAWLMLHKIRHAMSEADASVLLSGQVQVNDACYGSPRKSSVKRHPQEQPLLIGGSMRDHNEPLYVKMKLLPPSHLQETLVLRSGREEFVKSHVQPDSPHVRFTIGRYISRKLKMLFPDFAAAKQWINQTFHGLGPLHLQAYFNEFCYRLNQKRQGGSIFENLSHLCMFKRKTTYAALTIGRT